MDEIYSKIRGILSTCLEQAEWDGIGYDTDLIECGMDSLVFIRAIVEIEEGFDIEIPDEYLLAERMNTINKFADIVRGLLDENI